MRKAALLVACVLALGACDKKKEEAPPPAPVATTKPSLEHLQHKKDPGRGDLLVTEILTAHADREKPIPLVVLLHGRGGRPEEFASLFADLGEQTRMLAVRPPLDFQGGYQWFEAPVSGDQAALADEIRSVGERLAHTIADARSKRPTWGKTVVVGFSQGAMMAYWLAATHPELVDTAYPVAGYLPPPLVPAKLDGSLHYPEIVPVRCGDDDVIPNAKTDATDDALQKLGVRIEVHTYNGVGHHLWPNMANDMKKAMSATIRRIAAGERNPAP